MDDRARKANNSAEKSPEEGGSTNDQRASLGESERMDTLRERLYARGDAPKQRERHSLQEESALEQLRREAARREELKKQEAARQQTAEQSAAARTMSPQVADGSEKNQQALKRSLGMAIKKRGYRFTLILASIVFFIAAMGLSSLFLFFGNNTISGENITIDIADPPLAVGGGEQMMLQVAIANHNAVPIGSATLIVDYPPGTQSASQAGKSLTSERIQLNSIGAGEVINVPIRAVFFGEENEEKTVNVSVEYRIENSNATFFKEAEPWRFKITSSPVALEVKNVGSISSGQEVAFELTVSSNSPTPLKNILVKASYPSQFDFTDAEPATASGQDTWLIDELKPEGKQTIVIKGIVVGKQNEDRLFTFSVGVPSESNRFNLTSVYTKSTAEITIEDPFLGVGVSINESTDESVVINTGEAANVRINFKNTLEDTIYDGKITAKLSGNALNEIKVKVDHGFYDSTTNTITWDSVDVDALKEIPPGRTSSVGFSLEPKSNADRTPIITLDVTAKGQRVFEDRVPQELVGTASRDIRIASAVTLGSSALYSEGPFTNTGPTPPVAEAVTQYTYLLTVKNGSNDITDAEVTAVLPQYVTWLDLISSGDDVSYNSVNRTMTWDIGDMDANAYEEVWIQVSFLPSLSQVDTTPTLLGAQRLRATDRFTGTILRAETPALSTALVNDPDEEAHDGTVQEP